MINLADFELAVIEIAVMKELRRTFNKGGGNGGEILTPVINDLQKIITDYGASTEKTTNQPS